MRSRKCDVLIVLSALACAASTACAAETDALEVVAKKISEQIVEKPNVPAAMFSPIFLAAVPTAKMSDICSSLYSKLGGVQRVEMHSGATATHGEFTFRFKDVDMPVTLTIDLAEPHHISGLWFGAPTPRLKSWDELVARLAKLPGTVSFRAIQLNAVESGKEQPIAWHHPDKALAIGSAFKLYILATMVDKRVTWDEVVKLENRYKSLPSGVLQSWPDGSPLTVHTLATEMISISDNTAADQLLFYAGREEVEGRLATFGMKDPAANVPFLSTRELFRLKSSDALRKEYLAADVAGRRKLLTRIDEMPLLKLTELHWNGPIDIDRLEWLASAADLCRLLAWLDAHGGETAQAIMAVNTGKVLPDARFAYVGYKGGSEAGVISMNWLLHARDGRHYAMSAIWNNPHDAVDLETLVGLMSAAGDLLATAR
jgi:beta-lactamase class A